MVRVSICTTIDPEIQKIIKQKGYRIPDLIVIGLKTQLGMPEMTKRLGVTETELRNLSIKHQNLARKNYILEQKYEDLRKKHEN